MKWSKRHRREQRSDRNTGRGEKRVLRQTAASRKKNTEPGLETHLGTPPEPEPGKMSSTVKTLWDPKIRERGQ